MAGQSLFWIACPNRFAPKHAFWQHTTSGLDRADRMNLARNAAEEVHHNINPSTGVPKGMSESAILRLLSLRSFGRTNGTDTVAADGSSNRTIGNMLIVLASQDLYSGHSSWKTQVVDDTLAFYESGQRNLDNRVRTLLRTWHRVDLP